MGKSSLATETYLAYSGNYTQGRKGYKICKITPHHMAGVLTAAQCGRIFQTPGRQASANYGIGNDGTIALYVDEDNRAWTSSNSKNDCQAVTIEVSNSSTGGDWPISEAAWNSLVNLCVDICRRHNFRLNYTGDANGSLTRHNMFTSTSCPGPYLQSRFQELADTVNSILDGGESKPQPKPEPSTRKVGDVVTINGVYTASNSTKKLNPARTTGTITKIINGAHNPYLLDNGNLGWVNDGCIVSGSSSGGSSSGGKTVSQLADEVIAGKWGTDTDRRNRLEAAGYDYDAVQAEVNRRYGVGGSSSSSNSSSNSTIKKGDKVRVKNGAKDYNGTQLMSSVYSRTYDVIQVDGNRVVIGIGNAVTAAVNKSNLYKV